jgi:SET domain-containing protein
MTQAVILGLGSMFNHSIPNQNVGWERDVAKQLMTYTTLRDVKAGEELCISYGQRLTFKDTEEEQMVRDPDDWSEVMNYIDFIG